MTYCYEYLPGLELGGLVLGLASALDHPLQGLFGVQFQTFQGLQILTQLFRFAVPDAVPEASLGLMRRS